MAKINIEFDTINKTCTASMDGKVIEDFCGGSFYMGYDEKWACNLSSRTEDEDNDVVKYTGLMAKAEVPKDLEATRKAAETYLCNYGKFYKHSEKK